MKNCHPVLLKQIMAKLNIETPMLDAYITHRDRVLASMITKDFDKGFVKNMLLAIINQGRAAYDKYQTAHQCEWLEGFADEMEMIQNKVYEAASSKDIWLHERSRREKNKFDGADKGSFLNKLLIEAENECLMAMLGAAKAMGVTDSYVLCFDGLMVPKDVIDNDHVDELARSMEAAVLQKTGYTIEIVEKSMDMSMNLPARDEFDKEISVDWRTKVGNNKVWSEWSYIFPGAPAICNKTTTLAHNNERFVIVKESDNGVEAKISCDGSYTIDRATRKKIIATRKKEINERYESIKEGKRLTKTQAQAKRAEIRDASEGVDKDCIVNGRFVELRSERGYTIVVTMERLQKEYAPCYATTCHKSQGRTIDVPHTIHEIARLNRNGRYVALTRTTDVALVTIA
jgi:hypothetical protein